MYTKRFGAVECGLQMCCGRRQSRGCRVINRDEKARYEAHFGFVNIELGAEDSTEEQLVRNDCDFIEIQVWNVDRGK